MGDSIKGIVIEIGGDTTKLSAALSQAEKSLRETNRQLSAVEKSLKFDPGNVDLLADKERLLGERIEETKTKLDALQKAQAELDAKGVDKTSAEYRELQTEIDVTKSRLSGLNDQFKDFGSASAQSIAYMGEKVQEVSGKIGAVGDAMTKGVTLPLAGVAAASAAAWTEVDAAMDTVVTKTGAAGDALEDMQQRVSNIATTIPTSFQNAGDAVGEVNTRFGLTGDALESLSTQFIKFAEINGTDVSGSVDSVQAAMAAFGVSTEDAALMLDTLNKAGQDTGVNVIALADEMTKNGAALQEMGFSASDAAFFLANLNKNGVDSGTVLTGLKTAFKNATADGKSTSEALAEIQTKMQGAKSETEAMKIATELFGSKAGPAMAKALQDGKLSLDAIGTSMKDFAGNTNEAFEGTLDPVDNMTVAMNNLKDTGAELFTTIQTMAAPVILEVTNGLKELNNWFKNLTPQQQEMIVKIGLMVAAIGPLLSGIGKIGTGVGAVMKMAPMIQGAITAVSGAFTALTTGSGALAGAFALLTGPIGIAVAAIAGVVAVGVLVYKNWDTIKAKAAELGAAVKAKWEEMRNAIANTPLGQAAGQVWDAVKTTTSNALSRIKSAYDEHGGGMKGAVAATVEAYKQYYTAGYNFIDNLTGGKLSAIAETMKGKMTEAGNAVNEKLESVKGFFSGKLTEAQNTAQTRLTAISGFFTQRMSDAQNAASTGLENVKQFFSGKLTEAQNTAQTRLTTVSGFFTSRMSDMANTTSTQLEAVKGFFNSKLGDAANTAQTQFTAIASAAATKIEEMKTTISNGLDAISGFFSNLKLELPDIKLPHFSIDGKFDLKRGEVPSLSVDWYDRGGVFTGPSIIGVGEKRPEFVGALDDLRKIVREESGMGNAGMMQQMVMLMQQLVNQGAGVTVNQTINANDTSYVGQQKQAAKQFAEIARALS